MEPISTIRQIEQEAITRMNRVAKSYYQSGGNAMVTLRDNMEAFDRTKLCKAVEVDSTKFRGTGTEVLG